MINEQNSLKAVEEAFTKAAEVLLQQKTWIPTELPRRCEHELVFGRSPGGLYYISVWVEDDGTIDAVPMCTVGQDEMFLSVHGVPWPEQVPGLLERHADKLDDTPGGKLVDPTTG